jgi:hypothetical protein
MLLVKFTSPDIKFVKGKVTGSYIIHTKILH